MPAAVKPFREAHLSSFSRHLVPQLTPLGSAETQLMANTASQKWILILGGGFAGLAVAMELEKTLARDASVEVTLVNRDNFFLFTPMLHEVAASDLDLTTIVNPVRKRAKRAPGGVLVPLDLNNPPPELHDVMNFFEHMGYLLEGGYLNIEDVSVEFHYWILNVWADARKLIKSEQAENAIYYEFFEKMVNRLLEYDRPRTGALQLPTDTEIEDIYAEESHLPIGSPIPRAKRSKRRSSG